MDSPLSFADRPSLQQQSQQQGQLVPHYGPAGHNGHDSYYYQNYQIPSTSHPQYLNYASSTVAAGSNPPDLLEASYSSNNSKSLQPSAPGNTAEDVLAIFESAPAASSSGVATPTTTSATPPQDDAFISSFSKEDLAEQERLLREIQQRNSMVVSKDVPDVTVYEHQDRLWTSFHQQQQHSNSNDDNRMVPHAASSYPSTMTVYDEQQNNKLIRVPRSDNPTGSDAVHPRRMEMKQARKVKTATAATGGAIVGGVLFGPAWPLGVVVGGAAGAVAGKQISKAGERRAQRKWEKRNYQQYAASDSAVAKGGAAFA